LTPVIEHPYNARLAERPFYECLFEWGVQLPHLLASRRKGVVAVEKAERLDRVAGAIQERWGDRVLRVPGSVSSTTPIPHISTQFRILDQALGIGGIPRGKLTEIVGAPTSGMGTLTLKVMASAQAAGDMAVSVDPSRTFDPDYAAACDVRLESLLVIRPKDHSQGLDITLDLIASSGVGVLVYDLCGADAQTATRVANSTARVLAALAKSPCALIFLTAGKRTPTQAKTAALSPHAALRLGIEKERWLLRRKDVRGYRTRVTILKNKLAPIGRPVTITISFGRHEP
jgi:recombination protein RecA